MLRAITQQMQDDKRDFNRRMDDLVSHADIATVVQRTIAENLETVINPMVKTAVSDAMATTIDLHNMDNAGAVNEEAPAINAVSQQLENENRAALEGGRGDRREENENTMVELFDLHNMVNAGAANEEAPAINAVRQQLENENRAALEGGARRSSGGERKHHG
jgi:hypothetical protein